MQYNQCYFQTLSNGLLSNLNDNPYKYFNYLEAYFQDIQKNIPLCHFLNYLQQECPLYYQISKIKINHKAQGI